MVLGQGAQAVKDQELLQLVSACHPETIRIMKWTVQKLKGASPQCSRVEARDAGAPKRRA